MKGRGWSRYIAKTEHLTGERSIITTCAGSTMLAVVQRYRVLYWVFNRSLGSVEPKVTRIGTYAIGEAHATVRD